MKGRSQTDADSSCIPHPFPLPPLTLPLPTLPLAFLSSLSFPPLPLVILLHFLLLRILFLLPSYSIYSFSFSSSPHPIPPYILLLYPIFLPSLPPLLLTYSASSFLHSSSVFPLLRLPSPPLIHFSPFPLLPCSSPLFLLSFSSSFVSLFFDSLPLPLLLSIPSRSLATLLLLVLPFFVPHLRLLVPISNLPYLFRPPVFISPFPLSVNQRWVKDSFHFRLFLRMKDPN